MTLRLAGPTITRSRNYAATWDVGNEDRERRESVRMRETSEESAVSGGSRRSIRLSEQSITICKELTIMTLITTLACLVLAAGSPAAETRLWYRQPARAWNERSRWATVVWARWFLVELPGASATQ